MVFVFKEQSTFDTEKKRIECAINTYVRLREGKWQIVGLNESNKIL